MASIDLKKEYRDHYRAAAQPTMVDVPERRFLMIDGAGDPNASAEYADAVGALYPIAYGLRAAIKAATGDPYTVMPLEGLWWVDDMATFSVDAKGGWKWTMMICVPPAVTQQLFDEVAAAATEKKQLVSGPLVRVEAFHEGRAAQILHLGPYATEAPTIERLHTFIDAEGQLRRGRHHEIYLTDPRRVAPERNRTIIRQPVG